MPVNTGGVGSVTDNPRGEGIYRMIGPDGKEVGIPYSKAKQLGTPQGYKFADDSETHRFLKDYTADPELQQSLIGIAQNNPGLGLYLGFARHALKTVFGLADVSNTGSGGKVQQGLGFASQGEQTETGKNLRGFANEPDTTFAERVGGLGEETAEFSGAENFLKLLPELAGAQKLQTATKLAQLAEKHPLVREALTQASVAGGQTYVKTGDPYAAGEAAALTGIVSGSLSGPSARTARGIREATPGTATVAGQEFETPPARETPKPTKNQAAGQAAIQSAAQSTAAGHLQELNESRAPQPRQGAETEYFRSGNTWAERPRWGGRAHFEQIDVPKTVAKLGSYTDAATMLKGTVIDGYNQITDALALAGESPQNLTRIRQAYQAAEAKFMAAETPEAMQAAESEIERTHQELQDMTKRIPQAVNLKEFSGLNDSYRNALGVEKFSRAVDSAFMGSSTSGAARAGEYYGFNGKQLRNNIDGVIRSMGRGRVDRLVGRDNVETVLEVANHNMTNADRAKYGLAERKIQENFIRMHVGPIAAGGYLGRIAGLPWEAGAAAGWAGAEGLRRINKIIVTHPQIAKNLLYALDYGAKPENYGPFIATMIRQAVEPESKQEESNADEAR